MQQELLRELQMITKEEQDILAGQSDVQKDLYTSQKNFIVDSKKLLAKGQLIEIRPNTRFIHFPVHTHNFVEMVYMCAGSTTHIINGTKKILLQEGDILLLNQNVTQEILPAGKNDIAVNFFILPEFFDYAIRMIGSDNVLYTFMISALSSDNGLSSFLHFHVKNVLPVQNLVESMIWTIKKHPTSSGIVNKASLGLLFLTLLDYADTIDTGLENQYEQNLIFSLLKYIDTYYVAGTLDDFCQKHHLKTYTVSRLLKKHTSMTFKELLKERKLQEAAYLLTNTTLSTETIFHMIGYENSSFFHKIFREKYGKSPKEFRRDASL